MQVQGSVLYFQPRTATPFERKCEAAHRERERRIAEAARKRCPETKASAERETIAEWAARQRQIEIPSSLQAVPLSQRAPTLDEVQQAVSAHFGVSKAVLHSDDRTKGVALARHVLFYLGIIMAKKSSKEIARRTGGRDHSTVLSGAGKIERLMSSDEGVAARIAAIRAVLSSDAPIRKTAAMPVE